MGTGRRGEGEGVDKKLGILRESPLEPSVHILSRVADTGTLQRTEKKAAQTEKRVRVPEEQKDGLTYENQRADQKDVGCDDLPLHPVGSGPAQDRYMASP